MTFISYGIYIDILNVLTVSILTYRYLARYLSVGKADQGITTAKGYRFLSLTIPDNYVFSVFHKIPGICFSAILVPLSIVVVDLCIFNVLFTSHRLYVKIDLIYSEVFVTTQYLKMPSNFSQENRDQDPTNGFVAKIE